ncbi:MAG: HAD family hydrolase [Bacteroidaceae bacterium]|nr:HAD family hydrolase [Bacteroidaceae bacterium]
MITTLIFDLDGTLLNTLDDLHNSVSYALKEAGLTPNTIQDTRSLLGNGMKNLIYKSIEKSSSSPLSEKDKDAILDTFRNHYSMHSADKTSPYEGIISMLSKCKERGYITAIVSNKPDFAVKDLYKSFFSEYIDTALGETPDVKRKPAPDMVDKAIFQLSELHHRTISKTECIYIGDSEVDLLTAKNSQLPCIAVSWGFRDRDWLIECGATVIVDKPEEVVDAVSSISMNL